MIPLTVLLTDDESTAALPDQEDGLEPTRSVDEASDARRLFVLTSATSLPEVARLVSRAAKLHRLEGLFIYNNLGRTWAMQIYERASLRRIRNSVLHDDHAVGQRILRAAALGAEEHFIADATVADDRLFVMDCGFRLHEMPFGAYPALRRIPPGERGEFAIVMDGAYLHWPRHDVDLDLESVRVSNDPALQARLLRQRLLHDRAFGAAVRAFREERGLRQSDVRGLSERQLRRIETGVAAITGPAADALAAAHGMDPNDYLNEVAERLPE
jgi:Helix-turn-helix domain